MAGDYPNRPPYPPAVFDALATLADGPVLDVGCGTGDLARPLALHGLDVDAVDRSPAMIDVGRRLIGGDRVHWIVGQVENADLRDSYSLVTAGECVQWFDWETAFDRLYSRARRLAIVDRVEGPTPWQADLRALIARYSTNTDYRPYDLFEELAARGLFTAHGRHAFVVELAQPVDAYIASIHSRNGFSRDVMGEQASDEFDDEARSLLERHRELGLLRFTVCAEIRWCDTSRSSGR